MLSREEAISFLKETLKNQNILKHLLATEAVMAGLHDALKRQSKNDLSGVKEEWLMAGLLHDGDYDEKVPMEKQGIQVATWLREKGLEVPGEVARAMAAHNWHNTGIEPKTPMDWSLFCGDSLTGLIVATTLVHPEKKIKKITSDAVLKKFKDKAFARGTRREDIKRCEEKLNIPLPEFVKIGLTAMQGIADNLGL